MTSATIRPHKTMCLVRWHRPADRVHVRRCELMSMCLSPCEERAAAARECNLCCRRSPFSISLSHTRTIESVRERPRRLSLVHCVSPCLRSISNMEMHRRSQWAAHVSRDAMPANDGKPAKCIIFCSLAGLFATCAHKRSIAYRRRADTERVS